VITEVDLCTTCTQYLTFLGTFLGTLASHYIYSCDAGYQICAILSFLGRIGIISAWVLFHLCSSLIDPTYNCLLHHSALSFLIVAVWGSRAYAVFNRSKIILVIFGSLELVVLALAVVRIISSPL